MAKICAHPSGACDSRLEHSCQAIGRHAQVAERPGGMVDHAGRLLDHLLRSQILDQPDGDVEIESIEVAYMLNHRAPPAAFES